MTIRLMAASDYPDVYALWMRTPGMGLNDMDDSREGIERYLRRNPTSCFVAVEAGSLRGVILSGHDGRRGYIYHLSVDVACRRQGVASALLREALAALADADITKVALVVFERNQPGNAFWESKGFTQRGDLCYRNITLRPHVRIEP